MSYADAAASGPPQTAAEARAPPPPQVVDTTATETQNLIDVDTPHVASVPQGYESQPVQTDTQRARLEREAHDAELTARRAAGQAKDKAEGLLATLQRNSDNPVVIANGVLAAGLAGVLGYGAWRRFGGQAGPAPEGWAVGSVVAAVGAIAVGDYFASRWALQNKYPVKK